MLKTDENRNCNFAFPVFDLRRSFEPEVIPEVDDIKKMGLEEYYFVFFFNFTVTQKLTELRRFLILTFVVTSWPWPLTLKRNSDGATTKIHLWTNFGEDISKGSRVIRDLIKRRTNRQTDRQTVKPTYLPNFCEILASNKCYKNTNTTQSVCEPLSEPMMQESL